MTEEQLHYWCREFDCSPDELRWLVREAASSLEEEDENDEDAEAL